MRISQFLLFLIVAFVGVSCTQTDARNDSNGSVPAATPVDRTTGAVSIAPRGSHDGRVAGEVPAVIVNADGEKKLSRPKVWLEYSAEEKANEPSGRSVRVDLSPETEKLLDAHWQVLFDIIEKKPDAPDLTVAKWRTIASVKETKVNTPFGQRRISDYEAEDLVSFVQSSFLEFFEKKLSEQPNSEPRTAD